MIHDLRVKKIQMPVIPDRQLVEQRLNEVLHQAAKLRVLLRVATELEQLDATKGAPQCDS